MLCSAGHLYVLRSQHFTLRFSERFSLSASDMREIEVCRCTESCAIFK